MEYTPRRKIVSNKPCQQADFVDEKILGVSQKEFMLSVNAWFVDSVLAENNKQEGQDPLRHKSEHQRVKFVKKKFDWAFPSHARQPEMLKKFEKNSESSNLLRDHGNSLFLQRKFQDALHYYNLALLFGLGESVGLAYANRAAVLMELEDLAGAMEDIDLALKHYYPVSRAKKLEERKFKCLQMMEKKALQDVPVKQLLDEERIQLNKVRDSIGRIKKRNPKAPAAAEFVEIEFHETYGRQLVVTRDVDAGTLLLLEDPYVCVLQGQLNWDTEHCHHCFKRIKRGISCEKCVFAFYCDEACLTKSLESTHRFECNIMPYLYLNRLPDHAHEAVKLICKLGPAELYRLFTTRDPDFFNRKQVFGTAAEDKYESDSYLSVYHLESHPKCLDFVEQCVHIHQALLSIEYLDMETEFFKSVPKEQAHEFKDFVAAMMVRHIESHLVNAVALTEFDGIEDLDIETVLRQRGNEPKKLVARLGSSKFRSKMLAAGTFPLFSLLNHSCAPNAFYVNHVTNGTMAVVADRRIKKGEQIRISYVHTFFSELKEDRQAGLRLYNFNCKCIACRNNWPTGIDLIAAEPCFSCACSKIFSVEEKDSAEFLKCQLMEPLWMCGRCGQRYNPNELVKRLRVNMQLGVAAKDLLLRGQPHEAVRIALQLVDYFQDALVPPEGQTYALQELLCNAYSFILQLVQY